MCLWCVSVVCVQVLTIRHCVEKRFFFGFGFPTIFLFFFKGLFSNGFEKSPKRKIFCFTPKQQTT